MEQYQVDALLSPTTYPEATSIVALLQTHISYLFLTDHHVYKFKKPVNFGFLDFTTLEKRLFYCNEELRLNRRLSPDIYLEVVELRQDTSGRVSISGSGEIIDYAVRMVRLPAERMMARLLDEGDVTPTDITALAHLVATFHAAAARSPKIDKFGAVDMIRANWQENLHQAGAYIGRTLSARALEQISEWAIQRIEDDEELYSARVANGFIRECDGDLHSENICLDSRIHIFDCIEFNEKFRYSDTAADVAFMVMDLENHGRRNLAESFLEEYIKASGDDGIRRVLPLYLANRAFIRGKVESFLLDDPGIQASEKAAAMLRAQKLFRLSRGYILREKLPLSLFITCAPTGCGKSSLGAELAFQLGLEQLSSDVERKGLAGIPATEHNAAIYTSEWNNRTYKRLEILARERLRSHASVIVDGTFIRRDDRSAFAALAKDFGCNLVILRLKCPLETVRKRLAARARDPLAASDGTWKVFEHQSAVIEEPDGREGQIIEVDATPAPILVVEQVLAQLGLT